MSVSGPGAGTGALVRWQPVQGVLAAPRHERDRAPRYGAASGQHDRPPQKRLVAPDGAAPTGGEASGRTPPAHPRAVGDARALARFFAQGLEPAQIGTIIDTYA